MKNGWSQSLWSAWLPYPLGQFLVLYTDDLQVKTVLSRGKCCPARYRFLTWNHLFNTKYLQAGQKCPLSAERLVCSFSFQRQEALQRQHGAWILLSLNASLPGSRNMQNRKLWPQFLKGKKLSLFLDLMAWRNLWRYLEFCCNIAL